MTTVVFTSGILTIATETWCATELFGPPDRPGVQVHVLGTPVKSQCNLPMNMTEFLALIADGGKIVDLRGLQEVARPNDGNTIMRRSLSPDATPAEANAWEAEQRR